MDKDGYNDTQEAYERGFIDGMQKQMQSSVDKAVNGMTRTWVGLTKQDVYDLYNKMLAQEGNNIATRYQDFAKYLEAKLKEKNECPDPSRT